MSELLRDELLFERRDSGMTCEIHLVMDSHRRMFDTQYGYCGSKAKWWWMSYALCNHHKWAVQSVIEEQVARNKGNA